MDLSTIDNQSQIITSAPSTKIFTYSYPIDDCGLNCSNSINAHKITVTGGPNPGLITLPNPASASISFASSYNVADAGVYNVAVQISTDGGITWSAAKTATFTYINPCLTATIINTCPADFQVEVTFSNTTQVPYWSDSVTSAVNSGTTICALVYQNILVTSAPSTLANSTMYSKFGWIQTSGLSIITAAPTLASEVGNYVVKTTACLEANTLVCASCSVIVTVKPCQIISISVTTPANQTYSIGDSLKTWTLMNTIAVQTPACGYDLSLAVVASTVPSIVTYTQGSTIAFSAYSHISGVSSAYNMKIIATPLNYNLNPVPSGTFYQTLNIVDSCTFTSITGPTTVENLASFPGYSATSSVYTFNDTVSQILTTPNDNQDFCGLKTFTFSINSLDTALLEGNNSGQIKFTPTNGATAVTQNATLCVSM